MDFESVENTQYYIDGEKVLGYEREGHYDSDRKMELFAWGLGDFLHFVDRNTYPGLIAEDSLPMVLSFLDELGVDTEKEFTVNGTHCRMTEGKLQEAGSAHGGIPEDFYEKAVQRYTEYMKTSVYEIRDHKYVQMSLKA